MTECEFCDREFEDEQEMHLHWGEQHEEEMNSHQKEKVKKAERKQEEKEQEKMMAKRKKLAGKALVAGTALVLLAVLGTQFFSSPERTTGADMRLEGQPVMGNPDANVTVVEFGDYKCPYCQQFDEQTFPRLKNNYIETGKINYYFVNFAFLDLPDSRDGNGPPGGSSTRAAIASECVLKQSQEQFWNFHHAIYDNQGPERKDWATVDKLMNIANRSTEGLDYQKLKSCIQNRKTIGKVNADLQLGKKNNVDSTPTVFVNGNEVGNRYSSIKAAIEQQLQ